MVSTGLCEIHRCIGGPAPSLDRSDYQRGLSVSNLPKHRQGMHIIAPIPTNSQLPINVRGGLMVSVKRRMLLRSRELFYAFWLVCSVCRGFWIPVRPRELREYNEMEDVVPTVPTSHVSSYR